MIRPTVARTPPHPPGGPDTRIRRCCRESATTPDADDHTSTRRAGHVARPSRARVTSPTASYTDDPCGRRLGVTLRGGVGISTPVDVCGRWWNTCGSNAGSNALPCGEKLSRKPWSQRCAVWSSGPNPVGFDSRFGCTNRALSGRAPSRSGRSGGVPLRGVQSRGVRFPSIGGAGGIEPGGLRCRESPVHSVAAAESRGSGGNRGSNGTGGTLGRSPLPVMLPANRPAVPLECPL